MRRRIATSHIGVGRGAYDYVDIASQMKIFDPTAQKTGVVPTQFFSKSPATFAHEDLKKILDCWKMDGKVSDLEIKDEECVYEFNTVPAEDAYETEPVRVRIQFLAVEKELICVDIENVVGPLLTFMDASKELMEALKLLKNANKPTF